MTYKVDYTPEALKALRKMDSSTRTMILNWIDKNLEDCENPRKHGKLLKGDKKGVWRYRAGDYRILAQIRDGVLLILILDIGHRSKVYDR